MINANDYIRSNDSETLNAAIAARGADGIVVISPRVSDVDPERDFWLLDEAILLPENTTVILNNCKIKLSDTCRDNFFRTANCGLGIADPAPISNIHLRGEGLCILEGADCPRSTGDGGKILANPILYGDGHDKTFGSDAGKEGESQYGDWRNIGVLFANVTNFSIEHLKIVESHAWGISLEACSYGRVEKIEFDACMSKMIDGLRQNIENEDGVDLRNGCHHIVISDITGQSGDDLVALTAIADEQPHEGGELCYTHVMHNDWSRRDATIHDVVIRNVIGRSHLCYMIRLLPCNTEIYNIVVDGVIDTTPEPTGHSGVMVLGEPDGIYGTCTPDGLHHITISNVISNGRKAGISVKGYLKNSTVSNFINKNPKVQSILVARENGLQNVNISGGTIQ